MKLEWKVSISFLMLSVLTLSFQNCGTSMDGLTSDSTPTMDELSNKYGRDANKVKSAPFAFKASLNQITYTSCYMSNTSNDNSIFSIRAGAYSDAGVALNQDFLTYVSTNFKPTPPEKNITLTQYKSILADSPLNRGATLRLGLRAANNLQSIITFGSSNTPVEGIDYFSLGPNLSSDNALSQLIQTPGIKNHYFDLGNTPSERLLEGSLYFNGDEAHAKALRDIFINDATLALTYSHPDILTGARAADSLNSPQQAYGKGYKLQFGQANWPGTTGTLASSNPNNFLVGVVESNLDGSSSDMGTWTCDPLRRYMIVRAGDRATFCPKENFSTLETGANAAAYVAELAVLRRHLPASQWDINLSRKCIVPKGNLACYKSETLNDGTLVAIEYDQTKECFQGITGTQYTTSQVPINRCAQFVSVCQRH